VNIRTRGVRIGVDVGDVRIGVARSDPDGLIATPVETVARGDGDLQRLRVIAAEEGAVEVVVGLPRSLSGSEGPAAVKVRGFASSIAAAVAPLPVRLVDERLSTVSAEATLRVQGRKGRRQRAVVDQVAAVVILQNALDTERTTGVAPGEVVAATPPPQPRHQPQHEPSHQPAPTGYAQPADKEPTRRGGPE
jgi:putative holliday junction resolvase